MNSQPKNLLAVAIASLLVSSCGGGGDAAVTTGTLKLSITDAPVDDIDAVLIQFRGIALKPEGSTPEFITTLTPSPRQIDLLAYQQGRTAILLDNIPLTAGRYEWIRLIVDNEPGVRDSYVMANGLECELRVPSGAESGLKLNRGFTLPAGGSAALTVDFDLRQSLHAPPGQSSMTGACTQGYLLRPTLRLVDDASVGAITGNVTFAAGSVPVGCLPKVYLYQGPVVPDDLEEATAAAVDIEPYVTASVVIPEGGVSGTYRISFLPAGTYTSAFTCSDDTPADEALVFIPGTGQAVTVQNNLISTVDFAVPVP